MSSWWWLIYWVGGRPKVLVNLNWYIQFQWLLLETVVMVMVWPNGIIFHQPGFSWNFRGPISLRKRYLLRWGRYNLTRMVMNLTESIDIIHFLKNHRPSSCDWLGGGVDPILSHLQRGISTPSRNQKNHWNLRVPTPTPKKNRALIRLY